MKAIILAAGIASRLRPLTDNTPKCLLKIGERCLLERTLDALIENGIQQLIIVTGYKEEQIMDLVARRYPDQAITFVSNPHYDATNNIYSLYLARTWVDNEEILLLDSDIVFDPQIISVLLQAKKENTLALNNHDLGEEEIKIIADKEMKVLEISKTCSIGNAIGESIGIEKMSPDYTRALFKELEIMIEKENLSHVFYEQAFERLTVKGHFFYAIDTTNFFSMELDTVEDFLKTESLIPSNLY